MGKDLRDPIVRRNSEEPTTNQADPESPHFADQTRLYSEHGWVRFSFRASEISADRSLVTQELG